MISEPIATLEEYGLSVRTIETLEKANIFYIHDLQKHTQKSLLSIWEVNTTTINNIISALKRYANNDPKPNKKRDELRERIQTAREEKIRLDKLDQLPLMSIQCK